MLSVSPSYRELFTAGLLRPLDDFGLVTCINNQLLRFFLALKLRMIHSCFSASILPEKSTESHL